MCSLYAIPDIISSLHNACIAVLTVLSKAENICSNFADVIGNANTEVNELLAAFLLKHY